MADLILSRAASKALADRVLSKLSGPGGATVVVTSRWKGDVRWGRNRVVLAGDRRTTEVSITRYHTGASGSATTNQLSDAALEAAMRAAERMMRTRPTSGEGFPTEEPKRTYAETRIWSDATVGLTSEERGAIARDLVAGAEAAGMLSAGYLATEAETLGIYDSRGTELYAPRTCAQCALTVRDAKGSGSGWAGASHYDWKTIAPKALGERALEKGLTSRDPVGIEPGRYTVILEPQAVADLMNLMIAPAYDYIERVPPERFGMGPFADSPGFSKLGKLVMDPRITISHDPTDPELGVVPFTGSGEPIRPITWVDKGVLKTLAYERGYALSELNENDGAPDSGAFRMSGGTTTREEMIRTTRRGLLITRFSGIYDNRSNRMTGVTRDGTWLIENGQVTKPVKNLRFTQQLLVALSSVEQLGSPMPAFRPCYPIIVPMLKIRDFSFTSLADAV